MNDLIAIIQLLIGAVTLFALIWGLVKMFQSTREAASAREAAVTAARRAELAATQKRRCTSLR
jgi:hypothetical protein